MDGNKYSSAVYQSTKNIRFGCTVCPKKNKNDTLINSSSNKLWRDRNHLKNNVTNTINEKSKTSCTIRRPTVNECYCNSMERLKTESFPKLICSKHYKTPNLMDVNQDWLQEIIKFRHENWFDCHSDSFIDAMSVQNNNLICRFIFTLFFPNYKFFYLKIIMVLCAKINFCITV